MIRTRRAFPALAAFLLWTLPAAAAEPISFASLLRELTDTEAVARWPATEYTCRQASSYDRARVAPGKPGWFANNDHTQYVRREVHAGRKAVIKIVDAATGPWGHLTVDHVVQTDRKPDGEWKDAKQAPGSR